MALIDFEQLTQPISEAAPCGPDLDLEGDLDYMNLMARIEGVLPASFFTFERNAIDFKLEVEVLSRMLERTRDLRVLVVLAKLLVIDRNLADFARAVAAIADLLDVRWETVHPCLDGTDAGMRSAVVQTLNDLPSVILPLQYMPLVPWRRSGPITYRSQMIVSGEVARRVVDPDNPSAARQEPDPVHDANAIEKALGEGDLAPIVASRDHAARLRAAVGRIRTTWIEKAGFAENPGIDRLTQLSEKIYVFLDDAVGRRDPSASLQNAGAAADPEGADDGDATASEGGTARPGATLPVRSPRQAAVALAAVGRFLARREPSNPALLMVRQAEQLVGKSFIEIMTILLPDAIGDAHINVGNDQPVAFPIERLSSLMDAQESETDEASPDATEPDPEPEPEAEIVSRLDAMTRLDQVATFYRAAEPSSPIPLLMERARSFASRDFMSLLREIIPERR